MSIESRHKGIVIATDHFMDRDKEVRILPELLADDDLSSRITGLWVPKSAIDDDTRAVSISQLALGSRVKYSHSVVNSGNAPRFRLIIDTSSSGGVPDTLDHWKYITDHYPAPHTTFTVNLGAFAEVVDAAKKFKEYEFEKSGRIIDFMLATAYPENDHKKIQKFTKMDVAEYTHHVSDLAHEYDMAGVVGAGDLAQYTRVGQDYIALGVCINGAVDYQVRTEPWGAETTKKMVSPEDTYRYATNTEIQLSRTLFDDGSGEMTYPNAGQLSPERADKVLRLVKTNLLSVIDRLDSLPDPLPVPA